MILVVLSCFVYSDILVCCIFVLGRQTQKPFHKCCEFVAFFLLYSFSTSLFYMHNILFSLLQSCFVCFCVLLCSLLLAPSTWSWVWPTNNCMYFTQFYCFLSFLCLLIISLSVVKRLLFCFAAAIALSFVFCSSSPVSRQLGGQVGSGEVLVVASGSSK